MPTYVLDVLGSDAWKLLNHFQRACLVDLCLHSWKSLKPGFLKNDDEMLRKLCSVRTPVQWNRVKRALLSVGFEMTEDSRWFFHPLIVELWEEQLKKYESKSDAGRRAANHRWDSGRNASAMRSHAKQISEPKPKSNPIPPTPLPEGGQGEPLSDCWSEARLYLQQKLDAADFNAYFSQSNFLELRDGVLYVSVHDQSAVSAFNKYNKLLLKLLPGTIHKVVPVTAGATA